MRYKNYEIVHTKYDYVVFSRDGFIGRFKTEEETISYINTLPPVKPFFPRKPPKNNNGNGHYYSSHRLFKVYNPYTNEMENWIGEANEWVEDPHGPKISHNVIDMSVSHHHPDIPDAYMDFEDKLAGMTDEEYERYLYLRYIKSPRSPKRRRY